MFIRRLLVATLLFTAVPLVADSFDLIGTGTWGNTAVWTQNGTIATRYPGSLVGTVDTVTTSATSYTVTVDVGLAEAVTMNTTCPSNTSTCVVDVTNGFLKLTGASGIGADARLKISGGGTVANAGTLTFASTSNFDWTNGSLSGAGTTTIASGANLNATGTSMKVTGSQILSIAGTMTYGSAASGLQVNSGAKISVQNGGVVDIQNSSGIASDGVSSPAIDVLVGGMFRKTAGNFGTNIVPVLNNHGTVQTDVSTLVLVSGAHSGTFNMNGSTTGFEFAGTPAFQNGTAITGIGSALLRHVTITGNVSATNISMDSFGSISGSGTLTLSGTFGWRASSVSGITLNAIGSAAINITGEANTSLASAAHLNNEGTFTINPGATFSIVSDAHITNGGVNGGTLNIAGDLSIVSDGAPLARIDNIANGIINKTSGLGFTLVGVPVHNSGTVSSSQGALNLQKGGVHTGAFSLGTGAGIVFDGGTHQFTTGATMTGTTGTYELSSGAIDVDTAITLGTGLTFKQSGGVLTGAGNFTVQGPFLWTGGTMDNSSGAGQTILTGTNSQLASTASTVVLSGRTISHTGTFTYNPTPGIELSIDNGGLFLNTGTFNIVGDVDIDSNATGTPRFTNGVGGTINKSSGTGTAAIYAYFSNNATLNLSSGTITLLGGGQDLGTVNFGGATNKVIVDSCVFGIATSPTFTGGGVLTVTGAGARLALLANLSIGNLELLGGQIDGSGTLAVATSLLWQSGSMVGPGTTAIGSLATVDATSLTGPISIDNRTFENNGTFNWDGSVHRLALSNGAIVNNNGTFNAIAHGNITSAGATNTINNAGTFRKSGGTSGTRIDAVLANSGTVSSEVGGHSLIIAGGGSQTGGGTLSTSAGALLDFFSGTFTVPAATSPFSGSGTFRVNGGTLAITGSMTVPSPAILAVESGVLDVATSATLQVSNQFQWRGGVLQGGGTTRAFGGSIGNLASTTLAGDHTLTIPSTSFTYDADTVNFLTIGGTANLNVETGGSFSITGNGIIGGTSTDGVTVAGTLTKTGTGIARIDVPLTITSGTAPSFGATGGTLQINGGGSSLATAGLNTGVSGVVDFSAGTFTIGTGTTINGTGVVRISGAALLVNSALTIPNLLFDAGTFGGSGNVAVDAGAWNGGTMTGTGSVTIPATKTFAISTATPKTLQRPLTNSGTIHFDTAASAGLTVDNATLTNNGVFDVLNDDTIASSNGVFTNSAGATLRKSGGAGAADINPQFDNGGTVEVLSGALFFGGPGTHSGSFTVAASTTLGLAGTHTFGASSSVAGSGQVAFVAGANTIGGTYGLTGNGSTLVQGGSATFNSAASTPILLVTGGTLDGSGAFNVTGGGSPSAWDGGTIGGTGALAIAAGATVDIRGANGAMALAARTITNAGTINYVTATNALSLTGGADLINNGTFAFSTDQPLNAGAGSSFTNDGTFTKNAGAATAAFGAAFTNNNIVTLASGETSFSGGYTQDAGSTTLAGGNLSSPLAININGGILTGNGTITGQVISAATLAPGASPGSLTIAGDYTQTASGTLAIELGGTTAATGYDVLAVSGNAALGGTLDVSFFGTYMPTGGETYDVLTFAAHSGDFATKNLPTFPAGGSIDAVYVPTGAPTALQLQATLTQADVSVAQSIATPANVGQPTPITITITNNGPSVASDVALSESFTGATFVSVATSAGSCSGTGPISCTIGALAPGQSATVTVTVAPSAPGTVSSTATVSTSTFDTNTANDGPVTSSVPVNAGPAAAADAVATNEDTGVTFDPRANDSDADGDPLTITASTAAANGAAICAATSCTYTPNANFSGTDSFTYTISDGQGGSATATVTVTVNAVNDPPLANPDALATDEDTAASVNVLANDTDSDGNALSVTASTNGAKGSVSCTAAGVCTYSPFLHKNGTDTFTYETSDGNGGTAIGTVSVTIAPANDAPAAVDDAANVDRDSSVTLNVLANDSDPESDPLTLTANTTPAHGAVSCLPNGDCTYSPGAAAPSTDSFTYTVSDGNGGTAQGTVTIEISCVAAPHEFAPANGAIGVATTGTLIWTHTGASSFNVFLGAGPAGCTMPFGNAPENSLPYSDLMPGTTYSWRVEAVQPGCPVASSACVTFTTAAGTCVTAPPQALTPSAVTVASPVTFTWTAVDGATNYRVMASVAGAPEHEVGTTASTSLVATLAGEGTVVWRVFALGVPICGELASQPATFALCNIPQAPIARVVGQNMSAKTYAVEWDPVPGAVRYEIDEATNPDFIGASTIVVTGLSQNYEHDVQVATAFYYRVRAFNACSTAPGAYSLPVRIVIVPLPPKEEQTPNVSVPVGTTEVIVQEVFIPGEANETLFFRATTDRPWLTVRPANGVLPPEGVTLEVIGDVANLPNGTFTATVLVTITSPSASGTAVHATKTTSVPVSISLVTPVSPVPSKPPASEHAMIIPSVGHLDGINSHWQSDVRITNAGFRSYKYQLTFTPAGGTAQGVKQTTVTVDAGATIALDDIIRNWYGIGALDDSANGMLEILPLDDPAVASLATVASSRTYNVTDNGTLGQFVPAIRIGRFIGKPLAGALPQILGLQQIAQSAAFRTNVGIAEASGNAINALITIFDGAGNKLKELPIQLAAGEQRQLNSLLGEHGIEAENARIEVQVLDGSGKVTAYASVVDNASLDPLLVSGTLLAPAGVTKWVLPGAANLDNALAKWRTDMRVFNYGAAPQPATLTFFPFAGGTPRTTEITLDPGKVLTLDHVLRSLFAVENSGGAIHLTTGSAASLVVTGRTYNETPDGTFGQFIPAVTVDDATAAGGRTLHILQVEDSPRYRTNLGLTEISGKPAVVEVQIVLPDSKVTPVVQIPLAANEFRQFAVIREIGLGNVYNGRIAIRVISGEGRVTAYGSVIDELTQDPTYVPAQ